MIVLFFGAQTIRLFFVCKKEKKNPEKMAEIENETKMQLREMK